MSRPFVLPGSRCNLPQHAIRTTSTDGPFTIRQKVQAQTPPRSGVAVRTSVETKETTKGSREQIYARTRAGQRRLTGESAQDMHAHDETCRPDQDRLDTGAYYPIGSMVRESYVGIIGDAPIGAIPLGRVSTVRGSLRRHAYTVIVEGMMSARQSSSAKPAGLSQLNLSAAGIDVGATSHFVAVPADRAEPPVREFAAFTADLYRLAEFGVETVVMESTGVYWILLFGVLEERGFQVMLVDPRRIKNVSGRKTDVLDCQWLQQLHTYGLLSGAFRPDGEIRRLRSYLRQRAMLVEYASHHIQHMQKALTQMNVKFQDVIRDITGKTGMDIIEAIVGGERDPRTLARLRDPRIKADEATIARSLQGHWREEHIFELTQALELYQAYQGKIAECDWDIEAQLEQFEDHSDGEPPAPNGKKRNQRNAPRFDVQSQLYQMTGVDLTQIDGVDGFTALKVISEVGTDMTKWPSAKHFASWLGLSPDNRITGGRIMSSKTKPSANALHRSDSALGAFLRRKKAHLGAPAQGHHRHGPQAGPHHLFHVALAACPRNTTGESVGV